MVSDFVLAKDNSSTYALRNENNERIHCFGSELLRRADSLARQCTGTVVPLTDPVRQVKSKFLSHTQQCVAVCEDLTDTAKGSIRDRCIEQLGALSEFFI